MANICISKRLAEFMMGRTCYQFLFLFLVVTSTIAQPVTPQLDLSTPSDVIWVHLHFLQRETYQPEQAATVFYVGDSTEQIDWAIRLKQIYDGMGLYVHMNKVPNDPNYVDSLSKEHYFTPFPNELPKIYLEKIGSKWYYSSESAQAINGLHKKIYPLGTDALVHFFGRKFEKRFLGISLWQYAGFIILLLICAAIYFFLTFLFRWLIRRMSGRVFENIPDFKNHVVRIANVASVALVAWTVRLLLPLLQLPVKIAGITTTGLRIVLTILIMLLLLRVVRLVNAYFQSVSERTESKMDDQLLPILRQISKIVIIVAAILHVLSLLDFNITALIAGLSIGGLALALAAQDTVKNFLGSFMIFTDRPFQIGDWVEGSGFMGTVVQVGFRSTRIRTSDTSIISVPNGNMANVSVTNKGVRNFRLYSSTLGLTYDTPPALLEAYMQGVRDILLRHPKVDNGDIYVRFVEFGASSLNIFVRAYMKAATYVEELEFKESINLSLLRWAEHLGVNFAFPSTTMYVETFPGTTGNSTTYVKTDEELKSKWQTFFSDYEARLSSFEDEDVVDENMA